MATATNANNIDFNVGDANDDATHYEIWDAASGGNLLWRDTLGNNPAPLTANQFYRLSAGDVVLTFPQGSDGLQGEGAKRAADGFVSGGVYLVLGTFDGTTFTAETNRVAIAENAWTTAA